MKDALVGHVEFMSTYVLMVQSSETQIVTRLGKKSVAFCGTVIFRIWYCVHWTPLLLPVQILTL